MVPQGETKWIKLELMWNLSELKGGTKTGHSASSSGKKSDGTVGNVNLSPFYEVLVTFAAAVINIQSKSSLYMRFWGIKSP